MKQREANRGTDQFVVMTYASRTARFATVDPPAGYSGVADYTTTAAIPRITQTPDCFGDLTGDGVVDLQDLANLLSRYGTVC